MEKIIAKHKKLQKIMKKLFIYVNTFEFFVSFAQFFPVAQLFKNFNYKCPLHARFHINRVTNTTDYYIRDIEWSNKEFYCEYSIVSGILSVFYSIITLSFSLLFNKKTEKQFLPIWSILTTIQLGLISITVYILSSSLANLCFFSFNINFKCRLVQYLKWKKFITNSMFDYIVIASIASWLLTVLLILDLLIIVFRIRNYITFSRLINSKEILIIQEYSKLAKARRCKNFNNNKNDLNDTKL